jgi:hypothetical protein
VKSYLLAYRKYGGVAPADLPEDVAADEPPATLEALLLDGRWSVCGFPPTHPLRDFNTNGVQAVKSLTSFLQR